MSDGEMARRFRRAALVLLWVCAALHAPAAFSIDNPDAPDYVGEFEARAKPHEQQIFEQAGSTREIARAYGDYEAFLNRELQQAYDALRPCLSPASRQRLLAAQRQWLRYRDAEFVFIDDNWTLDRFGRSYPISRSAARVQVVRGRVVELLRYLKECSPGRAGAA